MAFSYYAEVILDITGTGFAAGSAEDDALFPPSLFRTRWLGHAGPPNEANQLIREAVREASERMVTRLLEFQRDAKAGKLCVVP